MFAPSAPATDPNFANVVLLCGFDGVDGATSLVDECATPHALTALSAAQIDTAQFKFGVSSLLLDGTNDAVSAADSADWEFGTGPFTVECFVRFNSVTSDVCFIGHSDSGGIGWNLFRNSGNLQFGAASGAGIALAGSWTPTTGVWYHLAVDRDDAGDARLYLDGVFKQKQNRPGSIGNPAIGLFLSRIAYIDIWNLNGWMDEVRITKGVARYASDSGFVVPAAAFPRS